MCGLLICLEIVIKVEMSQTRQRKEDTRLHPSNESETLGWRCGLSVYHPQTISSDGIQD